MVIMAGLPVPGRERLVSRALSSRPTSLVRLAAAIQHRPCFIMNKIATIRSNSMDFESFQKALRSSSRSNVIFCTIW